MLRHVHVCCITKENKGKYLDNFLKCEFKVVFLVYILGSVIVISCL